MGVSFTMITNILLKAISPPKNDQNASEDNLVRCGSVWGLFWFFFFLFFKVI